MPAQARSQNEPAAAYCADVELRTGICKTFQLEKSIHWGEMTWQVSNPAVLKLDRKTGTDVTVYPVKAGKADLIGKAEGVTLIYHICVTNADPVKETRQFLPWGKEKAEMPEWF